MHPNHPTTFVDVPRTNSGTNYDWASLLPTLGVGQSILVAPELAKKLRDAATNRAGYLRSGREGFFKVRKDRVSGGFRCTRIQ